MQGVPATVVCEVNLKTTTAYNFNFNGIYNKAYFDSAGSALPSYNSQSDLAVIHRTINYTLNNNTAIFNRGQLIISIDAA